MGVIFIDGFDHYATANLGGKWTGGSPGASLTISSGAARNGTDGLQMTSGGTGAIQACYSPPVGHLGTVIVGFALWIDTMPTTLNVKSALVSFCDGSSTSSVGIHIVLTTTGTLRIYGASSVKTDNWTGTALTTGKWYYVEVKCKWTTSSSTGDVEIRVDALSGSGPVVVNQLASGQTTNNTASSSWNLVALGPADNSGIIFADNTAVWHYDDFYILDPSGGVNTTYIGNCRVETLYPNGAGADTQWTPHTSTNWSQVSETSMDGSTSYVTSSTSSQKDDYAMSDLSSTPSSIYAIQESLFAITDSGTHTITANLVISGSQYSGNTSPSMTGTYTAYTTVWEHNPNTATTWTTSDINALEAGVILAS